MDDKFIHVKRAPRGGSTTVSLNDLLKGPENGRFPFTSINGFKLIDVEYKTPPRDVRRQRREQFNKETRPAFLKSLAETKEKELRAIGIDDDGLALMRAGKSVPGYNVHHKLPIAGGGKNEFSNLIIMPIGPHDELHHRVIDPQIKNKDPEKGVKIKLPWTNDMVWVRPAQKYEYANAASAVKTALMKKQGGR